MTLRRGVRCVVLALLAAGLGACPRTSASGGGGDSGAGDSGAGDSGAELGLEVTSVQDLDLLIEIDNSGSMGHRQLALMSRFGDLIDALVRPPCVSPSDPAPHACDPNHRADVPAWPPVRSLHVGVISSDLGTPGSSVPGCANSDLGDDGLLNPIRYGQAMQDHLPWAPRRGSAAPPGFRPDDCDRADQFPSFIRFDSAATNPTVFAHDMRCNAGLYVNGCGLEQQLEAVWRALVWHDARERLGNTDPNAGFLRDDAALAIVLLTDEEDGSVRDCRFARGEPCSDAIDVFDSASTRWASSNLNLRFYLSRACGEQDPTWPLDRYIDPRDATRGFPSLKPGHPERVVFAAITGVPLDIPTVGSGAEQRPDWDALLGPPGGAGRDDFCARDAQRAVNGESLEGPISMRRADQDPRCPDRVVPACRREGLPHNPASPQCTTTEQYFAWPARRIAEVARRFDQAPLCAGAPCGNGFVASICANDLGPAVRSVVQRITRRMYRRCLTRPLPTRADELGRVLADCAVRETLPPGQTECDAARGRVPVADGPRTVTLDGETRYLCDVSQVPTDPTSRRPITGREGWYYDRAVDPPSPSCAGRVAYTAFAAPRSGSITRLSCAP